MQDERIKKLKEWVYKHNDVMVLGECDTSLDIAELIGDTTKIFMEMMTSNTLKDIIVQCEANDINYLAHVREGKVTMHCYIVRTEPEQAEKTEPEQAEKTEPEQAKKTEPDQAENFALAHALSWYLFPFCA